MRSTILFPNKLVPYGESSLKELSLEQERLYMYAPL